MNIWRSQKWRAFYDQHPHRTGLRVRYEKGVDPEVRRACMEFCTWLRSEYEFPMRVVVYVRPANRFGVWTAILPTALAFVLSTV